MSREATPELVTAVRKAISDSYYDARNRGETMEWAADTATSKVIDIIASVDENAHGRGVAEERERIRETLLCPDHPDVPCAGCDEMNEKIGPVVEVAP